MQPRTFSQRRTFRFFLSLLMAAQTVLSTLLIPSVPTVQAASTPPILVVVNSASANPFGNYLGEILRAEGLNDFDVVQLSTLTSGQLSSHQVTILAETALTSGQATLFTTYVAGGGRLIAMRPDAQITSLFGLGTKAGTQTDGYLKFDTSQAVAQGLTSSPLQIHGLTDEYSVASGAVKVATLYTGTVPTAYPAVVLSSTVAAFTYDLVRNVVYTRQGNPANANKIFGSPVISDSQGITGTWDPASPPVTRTTSLFQLSNVLTAPAWVDRDLIPIPQADEQQRLLARLVQQLLTSVEPVPQLWYFPGTAKTMIVATGDAHANPTQIFTDEISSLASYGAKMTFYPAIASDPPDENVQAWRSQGYTFGIHPYVFKDDPTFGSTTLSQGYDKASDWYGVMYSSAPSPTVRNHQFAWQGWTDAADIAAQPAHGSIALDVSFADFGTWMQKADGTWPHGYITGSGLPMKFIRTDGTIVPVYQQLTEWADEQLMSLDVGIPEEDLGAGQATAVSEQMIDASLAGDYAALTALWHVDYFYTTQAWIQGTLAYAQSKGVPVWNADQWLNFTQVRHDATYSNLAWNSGTHTLSYSLVATPTVGLTLTTALPLAYGGFGLKSVTMDSSPYPFTTQTISGQNAAFISASAGNHTFTATYNGPLPGGSTTQSSYNDFTQPCAGLGLTNTQVSDINGGQIDLAGTFHDDFAGPNLNTGLWSSDTYSGSGSYNPTFSGGQITLPINGFIRSTGTYTSGVAETVADFGQDKSENIGFAESDWASINDRFIFFSTGSGDGLYARVVNGSEINTALIGAIPAGLHDYRLEWQPANSTQDLTSFLVDNVVVYTTTVTHAGLDNLNFFMSNDGVAANITADWAQVTPPYASSGSYASCKFDAGASMAWQTISWDAVTLNGTLSVQTRTSSDNVNWSNWSTVTTNGGPIPGPARYVQYLLQLGTNNTNYTPQINSVTLNYGPSGAVRFSEAATPASPSIGQTLYYTLTVTVPQTTTTAVVITETLPAGMAYVSWAPGGGLPGSPTFSHSNPTDGSVPVNLTWDFGGNVFSNTVGIVTFQARVANVAGNHGGTLLTSTGGLAYNNAFGVPQSPLPTTSSFTVVEPVMNLTKTVTPTLPAASDVVTVTLVMSNTGTGTAYDVGVQDPLPLAKFASATAVTTPSGFTFTKPVSGTNTLVGYSGGTLSPAQLATFVFTATMASGVLPGETLTNTATITQATTLPGGDPNERFEPPVSASALLTVTAPDLAAGITDGLSQVVPGQAYVYNLTITNTGQHPATGVVVSDTLSPNLIYQSATAGVTRAGNVLTWTRASLNGLGATAAFTVSVQVTNPVPAGTTFITNTINVRDDGLHGQDLTPSNNTMTETDPLAGAQPDLVVTKSDGGVTAVPGGQLMYTITYTNTGNIGSTNLLITDVVPVYSTFVPAASNPGWHASNVVAGTPITVSVSQLAGGGAHGVVTYTVQVDNPVPTGGGQLSLANTVSISDDGTNGADKNPGDNSGNATTSIIAAPDLQIAVTDGAASAAPGDLLNYTLTITNAGNRGATGIVITDSLPTTGVNFVSATPGYTLTNGVLTWTLPLLNVGGAAQTYTVTVLVHSPVDGGFNQFVDSAGVKDDGTNGADSSAGNNFASDIDAVNAAFDLQISKTDGVTSAAPGDPLHYTLTITNAGNRGATGIVITDSLPAGVDFVSATPGYTQVNGVVTWTLPLLNGGSTASPYTVTVLVHNPLEGGFSQFVNRAGVKDDGTSGGDKLPGNNFASDSDAVNATFDLQIAVSDGGVTSAAPGDVLNYALNVIDVGNRGATGIVITDSLPAGVTLVSATPGYTQANGVLTWTLPAISGGGAASYTVTVLVHNPVEGGFSQFVDRAGVKDDGTSGGDNQASNNFASVSVAVNATFDLQISKTDGVTSAQPGDLLAYTITITGAGNRGTTGLVITDSLPAGVTLLNATSPFTHVGNVVTWTRLSMNGGNATAAYTVTAQVNDPLGAGIRQLVNSTGVRDDGTSGSDSLPANNVFTETDTAVAAEILGIGMQGAPSAVTHGTLFTYTLGYQNSGNQDAAGVVITETVPASTTFNAANSTPAWSCTDGSGAGTKCIYTVGSLGGLTGSGTVVFAVQVAPVLPAGTTAITDTASIGDNNGATNMPPFGVPVVQAPDMGVAVRATPASFMAGMPLSYTIVYSNAGVLPATGVVITASVPTSTTLTSSGWSCPVGSGGGTICTATVGSVAAGGAGGTVYFAVHVTSPWPKGGPAISESVMIGDDGSHGADYPSGNNQVTIVTPGGGFIVYLPFLRR